MNKQLHNLYGFWIIKNYREAYDIFACNGILFNHTSPRRGENFVEKKIVDGLVDIKLGKSDILKLGNLNSSRDIGHAKEYVYGMWSMLQQETPRDFVLATGVSYTIREIVEMTSIKLDMEIEFIGEGVEEIGVIKETGKKIIEVDSKYFRPSEVDLLIGDASDAKKVLGWEPKLSLSHIIDEMIEDKIKSYGL